MEPTRIRIVCADDHPIVREGLRAILGAEADMEVVGLAADGAEAVNLFREHRPDIAIMDLKMPGMGGLQAVEEIRREFSEARIIVLTTYGGDEDIFQAIKAGVATYLLKESIADELVNVVREVHLGSRPIPQVVASRLAERVGQPVLTKREVEVLSRIARGSRNKEVGWELGISEETVQVHVKNILSKLNVHDRTQAVFVALSRGILHLE